MSRSSGFVPINYKVAGQLLFVVAAIAIILVAVARLSGSFHIPRIILWLGAGLIPVSLYLIFYAPKLDEQAKESTQNPEIQ
jgi:hypothetical protein